LKMNWRSLLSASSALALLGVGPAVAAVGQWSSIGPDGGQISVLVFDPRNSEVVYAAPSQGIFKSTNGGAVRAGRTPASASVPIASWRSPWSRTTRRWCSPRPRRRSMSAPAVAPAGVRAIHIPSDVYLASPNGFEASSDAGRSFIVKTPVIFPGPCISIDSFVVDPAGLLYASGEAQPPCVAGAPAPCTAFKSTDGGISWRCLNVQAVALALAPSSPSTLYAIGNDAPPSLSQTHDGGQTWSTVTASLPTTFEILTVDPTDPEHLLATDAGGGLWNSASGGSAWEQIAQLGKVPLLLALDPQNPAIVYVASSAIGAARTSDGGRTWQPLLSGLPAIGNPYNQLTVDPRSGTIYLATFSSGILSYTVPSATLAFP
jgi:hypothetical protein